MGKYSSYTFSGTYSCGHEGKQVIKGYKYEYCQEKAEENFKTDICPECAKIKLEKDKEEEYIKAKKTKEENGYPDLIGSPAQIKWAECIRAKASKRNGFLYCYDSDETCKQFIDIEKYHPDNWENVVEKAMVAHFNMLETETSAKFYIEHRHAIEEGRIKHLIDYIPKTIQQQLEDELEESILNENTLIPKETNGVKVSINQEKDIIELSSVYNEGVIGIAKSLYFRWDSLRGVWYRKIEKLNGDIKDRIIELSCILLEKGYIVILHVDDPEFIKKYVKTKEYKEEQKKWVIYTKNKLTLLSLDYNEALLYKAQKIKSAKKVKNIIYIDLFFYNEVLDFAEENNYKVDETAMKAIQKFKEELDKKERIKLEEKQLKKKKKEKEVNGILEDLIDED